MIKVKHPLLDIYRKVVSLMKINDTIHMQCTRVILLSSFMIYFFLYMSFWTFSYFIELETVKLNNKLHEKYF